LNIGLPEIVVLMVVVLIIFGPRRLPELTRAVGKGLREFRKAMRGIEDTFHPDTFLSEDPPPRDPHPPPADPTLPDTKSSDDPTP
jgi:TatA/E family protein of Tat protein translocase